MADEPNDPWSYGVTSDDPDPPLNTSDVEPESDDTARHHTGRWTSPSLGAYDPSAEHEALGSGNGADDAYFRNFGYGEGFGDGRLAAGYDGDAAPSPKPSPGPGSSPDALGTDDPPARALTDAGAKPATQPRSERSARPTDPERFDERSFGAPEAGAPRVRPGSGFEHVEGRDTFDDLADDDVQDDLAEPREGDLDDGENRGTDARRNMIEWAVVLVGAVLLALVLRALVLQAFWIPSPSMESTLLVRDRVLVNKVSYRVGDIGRGDVIVFRRTDEEISQNPELPRDVIKRVIALEGETIEIIEDEVFIDGLELREPYLDAGVTTSDFGPETVPDGHVFVMGDNRELSLDSRFDTGPIAEDRVVGRAFFLFWPLNRIGSL